MDDDRLRRILQRVIANDLRMPVDYLRRAWAGPYNPERHLFSEDGEGRPVCVWMLDADTWESVGDAYCRWHLVRDARRFWTDASDLARGTHEWAEADESFVRWLREKVY